MLVVKLLRELHLVVFPNINPSRVRNSLIDTDRFKIDLTAYKKAFKKGEIDSVGLENLIRTMQPLKQTAIRFNPHSSTSYRSVQLTCRQPDSFEKKQSLVGSKKIKSLASLEQISEPARKTTQEFLNLLEYWPWI